MSFKLLNKITIGIVFLFHIWLLCTLQLFGDEAFYWLEGQHLAMSYAELPGFTAWMIRLGSEIFGHHYFAVRFFSYCGFLSVFMASWRLTKRLFPENSSQKNQLLSYLSMLSVPILSLVSINALPDVWMLAIVMWITLYFIKAIESDQNRNWLILGLLLACAINIHVRMWIWLFFAGMAFLFLFYHQTKFIKKLFILTLPVTLMGFLPILIFNLAHEFPLIEFQFSERHPWQFQPDNLYFILTQIIVVTPLVLILWINTANKIKNIYSSDKKTAWIILTAFLHCAFYLITSLFADGTRTSFHWLLISYIPILSLSPILVNNSKLKFRAIITGMMTTVVLLAYISFNNGHNSHLVTRFFDNSTGWKELASAVKKVQKQQATVHLIADYFMTGAELAYELKRPSDILVLAHEKNTKHGREKQLEIMGLYLEKPKSYQHKAILVVENTALKLKQRGEYFKQLCDDFNHVEYLESLEIRGSKKQFHMFYVHQSQTKTCQIPPLFYIDTIKNGSGVQVSGWAILDQIGIKSLSIFVGEREIPIPNWQIENTGIAKQFYQIKDPHAPYNGFELTVTEQQVLKGKFQIKAIGNNDKIYKSQYYLFK